MNTQSAVHRLCAGIVLSLLCLAAGAHDYRAGDVVVLDAWMRLPPPVAQAGAAYMLLRNDGDSADRLLGVATDIAGRAELHTHAMDDGVMKMRQVEAVAVPAGGEVQFGAGSLHIMLMGLKRVPKEGESVPMTLRFERGGEVTVEFVVQRDGSAGHGSHQAD